MARQAVEEQEPTTLAVVHVEGRASHIVRTLAEINFDDLTDEVQRVGGDAVWWGVLAARAKSAERRAILNAKIVEAETDKEIRQAMRASVTVDPDKKPLTEPAIKARVLTDARVRAAQEDEIKAQEQSAIVQAVHGAIEQKQRTLNGMSLLLLREQNALTVAADSAIRDTIRDRLRGEPRAGRGRRE